MAPGGNGSGFPDKTRRIVNPMNDTEKSQELDRAMGITNKGPFVSEDGTKLVFDPHATVEDADAVLASLDKSARVLAHTGIRSSRANALRVHLRGVK